MSNIPHFITLTIIAIASSFLLSCSEVIELVGQGGEKPLRNAELPPPSTGPRVLLFALDGVGYDQLMEALHSGQFLHLQTLLGTEKQDGLFEHGYAVPNAISILPSTTMAAWASVYTGEPPSRTGVPGNEWFVREQMRFFAPGAVSVTETEHFFKLFTDGLLGDVIQTPTLYELLGGLRSHVSLGLLYRGASLLTTPEPKVLWTFFATFLKGVISTESVDRDIYSTIDEESVTKLIDALKEHGVPALQVVYFPGIDLFTHVADDPLLMQVEYLEDVIDKAVGDVLETYAKLGVLDETYVLFVSDHGHTPVLNDDRHALGAEGDDEPPALIKKMGFRLRKFVLDPAENELDYQATVAYQGAIAYVYLTDRSICSAEGDRCDWRRPPRLQEDVMPVVRAFYEVNKTGNPIPALKGTLDLIFARPPRPPDQDALPFQVFDGKKLVPLSTYLARHPRPDLLQLEKRMQWLGAGPYGHRAGDILLLARSGLERPIEERFYFSGPYHSWHGSPETQDSHIPLILARKGESGEKLQTTVKAIVGKSPSQLHVVPLVRALLEDRQEKDTMMLDKKPEKAQKRPKPETGD